MKLRSVVVTGGRRLRTQEEALEEGVSVLVGTPGRVRALLDSRQLKLDDLQALVLDECDVLLGARAAPLVSAAWILVPFHF